MQCAVSTVSNYLGSSSCHSTVEPLPNRDSPTRATAPFTHRFFDAKSGSWTYKQSLDGLLHRWLRHILPNTVRPVSNLTSPRPKVSWTHQALPRKINCVPIHGAVGGEGPGDEAPLPDKVRSCLA